MEDEVRQRRAGRKNAGAGSVTSVGEQNPGSIWRRAGRSREQERGAGEDRTWRGSIYAIRTFLAVERA